MANRNFVNLNSVLGELYKETPDMNTRIFVCSGVYLMLFHGTRQNNGMGDLLMLVDFNHQHSSVVLDMDDNGFIEGVFYEPEQHIVMLNIRMWSDQPGIVYERTTLKIKLD